MNEAAVSFHFAEGKLHVGGVQLVAPLEPYGHVKLFEAVQALLHDELIKVATELQVPYHPLLSTHSLMLMVGHHVQKIWYAEMGAVPENVQKNYEAQLAKHAQLVQNLTEGKVDVMAKESKAKKAKKAKGPKAAKAPKAERKPLTYRILSSKIDAKLAKKLENKEAKVHDTIILQILSGLDGDIGLSALAAKVEATGRYETNGEMDDSVRYHLNKLEKAGLVKATEAA